MKIAIIDDEEGAINSLSIILNEYCDNVEIVGSAQSALKGIQLINEKQPDLVLLDVEMPGGSGFDLLENISDRNFHIIFTTAYDNYAIKAIRANAIDYLMKPIDIDELLAAIENVRKEIAYKASPKNNNLLQTLKENNLSKIPISIKNEYLLLDLEDIFYIKSDGSYSIIHTFDKKYTTAKNLKFYENLLCGTTFFRVSHSRIINLEKVVKYIREDGGVVELRNKAKISVSKNKNMALKRSLGIV